MISFPVDTETCLILSAFNRAPTLRAAATQLSIDPAALVRKVKLISEKHGLLQKVGNRWALTETGRRVAQWTDEALESQKSLWNEKPQLRIASYSWLAEEMLIPQFTRLQRELGNGSRWSFHLTSLQLEQELTHGRADFVIQGHAPNDPSVAYRKISTHPWVAILPIAWKKEIQRLKPVDLIEFLQKKPMIRHAQVNPSEAVGFDVTVFAELSTDSIVGVRTAVAAGLGWSVAPRMSIQSLVNQQKVCFVQLPTNIKDEVSVWWLRARKDVAKWIPLITKWIGSFPLQ